MYLGKDDQEFDLNYISELEGEKTNVEFELQGALKDRSRKHFKGTIDFKKRSKKSTW
ncbi:MAG: SufD family Fe-S cluster assembly protein [Clostridia bacterium]|nr:SufD family Fe-S cluster assembly protein [Clostridia bacterium]